GPDAHVHLARLVLVLREVPYHLKVSRYLKVSRDVVLFRRPRHVHAPRIPTIDGPCYRPVSPDSYQNPSKDRRSVAGIHRRRTRLTTSQNRQKEEKRQRFPHFRTSLVRLPDKADDIPYS